MHKATRPNITLPWLGQEGKTHGFTHCFCLTFDTEADRDAYLPHPAHVAYGEKHVKAADVLVLDTLLD